MTDDPHDAFHPVIRDGVWWCEKHNEDAETCMCGRDVPYGSQLVVNVLAAIIILVLIVAAFWIL